MVAYFCQDAKWGNVIVNTLGGELLLLSIQQIRPTNKNKDEPGFGSYQPVLNER
jgi:hypothetical protein